MSQLSGPMAVQHCAITRTGWTLIQVYYIVTFSCQIHSKFHSHINVKLGLHGIHDTSGYSLRWLCDIYMVMVFSSGSLFTHILCVAEYLGLVVDWI